jgi:hypothetical protein
MPFSPALHTNLVSDIHKMFPIGESEQPTSLMFMLMNPAAPMVTISRDPRMGSIIVPHFFFTTENPDHLLGIASAISKNNPVMPLFHIVEGSLTGRVAIFPFLYNRFPSSLAFVNRAKQCGEILVSSDLVCAYDIMDCSLMISSQGRVTNSSDYKAVFDHLVK